MTSDRIDLVSTLSMQLLELEKPDTLSYYDLCALVMLASIDIKIKNMENLNESLSRIQDLYDDLSSKGFLNEVQSKKILISILKTRMLISQRNDDYDSLLIQSEDLLKKGLSFNDTIVAYLARSWVYIRMERPDMAEEIFRKILNRESEYNISTVYSNIITTYLWYVEMLYWFEQYDKCVAVADEFSFLLDSETSSQTKLDILQYKARALSKLGRIKESDPLYREILDMNDSIQTFRRRLISENAANYNLLSAINEKDEAQKKASMFQTWTWILLGLLVAILAFTIYLLNISYKHRRQSEAASRLYERGFEKIESKHRELTSLSFQMLNMHEVFNRIETIVDDTNSEPTQRISELKSLMREKDASKSSWEAFKHYFEESHYGFIDRLTKLHPKLSENDVKLCTFMVLNFNTKEIAALTHRSVRTIDTIKYRLHKKLNLSEGVSTLEYLRTLS